MDDLISRQDAIKAIDEKAKRIKNEDTLNGLAGAVGILFDLPSVKPQEPCTDAVSREAVLEAVSEGCQEWRGIYGRCEELINELPSVTQKSEKWIPVSEKLPSDCNEDWVLAQIQEDNGYLWIPCVAEYRKDTDDWYSDANDIGWLKNHRGFFKVIAWMPLPKPYDPQEGANNDLRSM